MVARTRTGDILPANIMEPKVNFRPDAPADGHYRKTRILSTHKCQKIHLDVTYIVVKASVVIVVKKYWYPSHLPYLPHCKVRMRFPAKCHIFIRALGAEWFISPLTAHIYIAPIEKGPPSLPHLLYLCNLSNDRNIQNHIVLCPNHLGEFLSIENRNEEIP